MAETPNLRQVLQAELITAMKNQDRATMVAIRSVLSAISNKEAVASTERAGAIEQAPRSAEAPRQELTHQQMKLVLLDEIESRRNSAGYLRTAGREDEAAGREAEAAILERYLYLT
ncbi:MAG TPA: GatB/YqeY domain-containing protein [Actinomycetota bacterium]|nr:GatB/YqeY domain-containing protein [Actinomycetota bacterium]